MVSACVSERAVSVRHGGEQHANRRIDARTIGTLAQPLIDLFSERLRGEPLGAGRVDDCREGRLGRCVEPKARARILRTGARNERREGTDQQQATRDARGTHLVLSSTTSALPGMPKSRLGEGGAL